MKTRLHHLSQAFRLALSAAVIAAAMPIAAQAQTITSGSRWQPWLGCWQAADPSGLTPRATPVICVLPTSSESAVRIATLDSGKIVSSDTVDASGVRRAVDRQGCAGWQTGRWSADGRRVFLATEMKCVAGIERAGSGIFAMSPAGDWLDIESVASSGNSGVRVNRYRSVSPAASVLPAGVTNPAEGRQLAAAAARTAAGAPITGAEIVEAVKRADTAVVQAWIVARGARFNVDAKSLTELADAGVPGSVTDVLIGLSYPEHFALQQAPMPYSGEELSPVDSARIASRYAFSQCFGRWNPLWYSPLGDPCSYGFGLGAYRYGYPFYGYSPYGYSPYGYSGLGYGYYPGYVTYAPVVVVKGDNAQHGQVVKGHGYTRGSSGAATSGSASPRGSTSSGSHGSASTGSSGGHAHAKP